MSKLLLQKILYSLRTSLICRPHISAIPRKQFSQHVAITCRRLCPRQRSASSAWSYLNPCICSMARVTFKKWWGMWLKLYESVSFKHWMQLCVFSRRSNTRLSCSWSSCDSYTWKRGRSSHIFAQTRVPGSIRTHSLTARPSCCSETTSTSSRQKPSPRKMYSVTAAA